MTSTLLYKPHTHHNVKECVTRLLSHSIHLKALEQIYRLTWLSANAKPQRAPSKTPLKC